MSQETFDKEVEAQRGKGGRTVLSVNKLDGRSQLWEYRDGVWHFVSDLDSVTKHPLFVPHPHLFHWIPSEKPAVPEPKPPPPPAPSVMDLMDEQLIELMDAGKK